MYAKLYEILSDIFNGIDTCSVELTENTIDKLMVRLDGKVVTWANISRDRRYVHEYKIVLSPWSSDVRQRSITVRLVDGGDLSPEDHKKVKGFCVRMIKKIKDTEAETIARNTQREEAKIAYNRNVMAYVEKFPDVTFNEHTGHVVYNDTYPLGVHYSDDVLKVYVLVSEVSYLTKKAVPLEKAIKIIDMIME